jgi:hypothetical protein
VNVYLQIGSPKEVTEPNMKHFDPRSWQRAAEKCIFKKATEVFAMLSAEDICGAEWSFGRSEQQPPKFITRTQVDLRVYIKLAEKLKERIADRDNEISILERRVAETSPLSDDEFLCPKYLCNTRIKKEEKEMDIHVK